jgi:hypothetical protein
MNGEPINRRFVETHGLDDPAVDNHEACTTMFLGPKADLQARFFSSLASTCRRRGIDPQYYLTQLLTNLPATPINQLQEWLPDRCKRRNLAYPN